MLPSHALDSRPVESEAARRVTDALGDPPVVGVGMLKAGPLLSVEGGSVPLLGVS